MQRSNAYALDKQPGPASNEMQSTLRVPDYLARDARIQGRRFPDDTRHVMIQYAHIRNR